MMFMNRQCQWLSFNDKYALLLKLNNQSCLIFLFSKCFSFFLFLNLWIFSFSLSSSPTPGLPRASGNSDALRTFWHHLCSSQCRAGGDIIPAGIAFIVASLMFLLVGGLLEFYEKANILQKAARKAIQRKPFKDWHRLKEGLEYREGMWWCEGRQRECWCRLAEFDCRFTGRGNFNKDDSGK